MNFDHFAPWEHYPKTLNQAEIASPHNVLADFFVAGGVQSHKRKLKKWRNAVTSDTFYCDEKHGPGDLLFTYDLNLKLLEAVYLLWVDQQNKSWNYKVASDEQIANEKETWEYFPQNLKAKDQANPYGAVKKVFKKTNPQQYREYLHEWLYFALYNMAADEDLTAGEILSVYESLKKLYSAAWLIFQREAALPELFDESIEEEALAISLPELKALFLEPSPAEALAVEELKKLILERFPAVRMIVNLGTHPKPYTFYLLILIDDDYKTPEHAISNKIEDNCKYFANVLAQVHKLNSVKTALKFGSRFWSNVVKNGHIVYQSQGLNLSPNPHVTEQDVKDTVKYNWERWGLQGKDFIKGAVIYQRDHNYRLAAFLLHQAVESILKAMIQAVLGYKISSHNIGRMLEITLLFTDALYEVFELDTTEGEASFLLLQNAYSEARYKDEFNPDENAISLTAKRVKSLYNVARQVLRLIEVS